MPNKIGPDVRCYQDPPPPPPAPPPLPPPPPLLEDGSVLAAEVAVYSDGAMAA
jgi:hypothetical protein